MSLINLSVPVDSLTSLLNLLDRIAIALERLAGPALPYAPPTMATLQDYHNIPPDEIARIKEAEEAFSQGQMIVPGSPAYIARVEEFERAVQDAYGEEALVNLPWRVKPGA